MTTNTYDFATPYRPDQMEGKLKGAIIESIRDSSHTSQRPPRASKGKAVTTLGIRFKDVADPHRISNQQQLLIAARNIFKDGMKPPSERHILSNELTEPFLFSGLVTENLFKGLVGAGYTLSSTMDAKNAQYISHCFGVAELARAFSDSGEHLEAAISAKDLEKWALFRLQSDAGFVADCIQAKQQTGPSDRPIKFNADSFVELLTTYHNLETSPHLRRVMEQTLQEATMKHLGVHDPDKGLYLRRGGMDHLDTIIRVAEMQDFNTDGLVAALRKAMQNHAVKYPPRPEPTAFEPG